jgi:flagellin
MGISIRTNVASLDAQRNLSSASNDVNNSMRKLASGYRITRGADDSAGLAISEKLRSQVTGTNQAIKNSQDGISMLQTAEGGLSEITNIVQRMRELGVQAGNGTLSASDHSAISKELVQLKSEVSSIAGRTTFNGHTLINSKNDTVGATSAITLQVGSRTDGNNDELVVNVKDFSMTSGGGEFSALAGAIDSYAGVASNFAASTDSIASGQAYVRSFQEYAAGANNGTIATTASTLKTIVGAADQALDKLNLERAEIGSKQNRLEHNITVQQNQSDNLAAAQSRIQDVDVAAESAKMAKSNILQSAAVSILSQANQAPQLAQKLLG